jgi:hypothetical protein
MARNREIPDLLEQYMEQSGETEQWITVQEFRTYFQLDEMYALPFLDFCAGSIMARSFPVITRWNGWKKFSFTHRSAGSLSGIWQKRDRNHEGYLPMGHNKWPVMQPVATNLMFPGAYHSLILYGTKGTE